MSLDDFLLTVKRKVMDGGVMCIAAVVETECGRYVKHQVTFTDIVFRFTHDNSENPGLGDFRKIPLGEM